jgi:hypothetical protein
MVPDATLHGTAGVIVLHSKSNKRSQSSIVFWYCALNLKNSPKGVPQIHTFTSIPTAKRTSWQCKTKQVRLKRPWLNLDYSQNWILQFYTNNVSFIDGYGSIAFLLVSYIKTRSRTFISRKGMSRLRSTLESKFKSFTARLKYRLVASKAFMGFFKELMATIALSSINSRPQKITIEDAFESCHRGLELNDEPNRIKKWMRSI